MLVNPMPYILLFMFIPKPNSVLAEIAGWEENFVLLSVYLLNANAAVTHQRKFG